MHIDDFALNALGLAATGFSILMWIPQGRTTWMNRNDATKLAGVSEATQWMLVMGYLLWGVFGVLSESLWVAAPSVVAMPLALATIVLIHRGKGLAPATRSVSIIAMDESLSAGAMSDPSVIVPATTQSIPIISTETSVGVGETTTRESFSATGPIPILS